MAIKTKEIDFPIDALATTQKAVREHSRIAANWITVQRHPKIMQ